MTRRTGICPDCGFDFDDSRREPPLPRLILASLQWCSVLMGCPSGEHEEIPVFACATNGWAVPVFIREGDQQVCELFRGNADAIQNVSWRLQIVLTSIRLLFPIWASQARTILLRVRLIRSA